MNERLQRVVEIYERRGTIDKIQNAGIDAARACLARGDERFAAAQLLLESKLWDPAYTNAYDAYRSAADAVLLLHGYRTTASQGAQEAAHAFAAAALDDSSPFAGPTASAFRQGRHASEYFDPERSAGKTEGDARWALDQASRACSSVAELL